MARKSKQQPVGETAAPKAEAEVVTPKKSKKPVVTPAKQKAAAALDEKSSDNKIADVKADGSGQSPTSEKAAQETDTQAPVVSEPEEKTSDQDDEFYAQLAQDLDVTPEPEHVSAPEYDHHDEHSLAGKVLRGLFILAIGGGIALWGGPKLAPHLPAGMAPVANFLTPGADTAKDRVEALATKVDTRLSAVQNDAITQEDIAKAIAAYDVENQEIMDELQAAQGGTASEGRLAQVETRLEGVSAELATLSEALSGQGTATAGLSEETKSQLAAYQATVNGLRAEIDDLSAKQSEMIERLDGVAALTEKRVNQANSEVMSAETQRLVTDIDLSLDRGTEFKDSLKALEQTSGNPAPEALTALAEGGSSLARLRQEFSYVAITAVRASNKANADAGSTSKIGAFLKSQIGVRSTEPRAGDDADAVLSRVEALLNSGDLDGALNEAKTLPGEASEAMADWLQTAGNLTNAKTALAEMSAAATN